ncbi:MAG: exodeoxyribonuclease V subunit alpha [Planctomycetota bacterium]|jgi:exodeoxyribonuclease V alpha subunit
MPLIEELAAIRGAGAISPIAWQFARFVCRHADANSDGKLFLAAILTSQAVESSHVCADLELLCHDCQGTFPQYDPDRALAAKAADAPLPTTTLPLPGDWIEHLRNDANCQRVVCTPTDYLSAPKPLVIDDANRLYLHRYYDFERQLATALTDMTAHPPTLAASDPAQVQAALETLFPAASAPGWEVNWPKVAGYAALNHCLTIVTGGPGTGKTTVVARLLALLQQLCGSELKVRLAAPTGKAAARLGDALEEQRAALAERGIASGPVDLQASTIHRMLGYRRNSIHFRHNADNPLDADLVIIDEASMVPLPMMKRIVDAVPHGARLILLGDMHQLASVESGYVLGDLCAAANPTVFSDAFRAGFAAVASQPTDALPASSAAAAVLSDCCVPLTYSWRFPPDSRIDRVSRAVNSGGATADPLAAAEALRSWDTPGILAPAAGDGETRAQWKAVPETLREANYLPNRLFWRSGQLLSRYQAFLAAADPIDVLGAFEGFRILCATRSGPHGVYELNRLVEEVLSLNYCTDTATERARLAELGVSHTLPATGGAFYDHQPILITENNYGLGLFNGDTGVVLKAEGERVKAEGGRVKGEGGSQEPGTKNQEPLLAWFPPLPGETEPRPFAPELLPAHETAFAMTVHKSQGSQFPDVLVVLPHQDNPVLGRELIYTAITRASARVELWVEPELFHTAVQRKTTRHSGLPDLL